MIDAGPLIALFDRTEAPHVAARATLSTISDRLFTTVPVLVEAAHLLQPSTPGGRALRDFVLRGAVAIWYLSSATLTRCFALMEQYADQPMDLADASLVVAAERLRTSRIFTLDRKHFSAYRIRRGHRLLPFELV